MGRLSKQQIDDAKADEKDFFLWDTTLPGFGIRIRKSGLKIFVVQYRNKFGRTRRQSVGRYGTVTLDEARREAKRHLSSVGRGADPAQERDDDRRCLSVRELADRYMSDHCNGRCKPSTIAAHNWLLSKFILPELGERAITELKQYDIDRLHQSLKKTPFNANRVLGLLRAMYGRAEIWKLSDQPNPAAGVQPFRERKRQRFLREHELGRLARALDDAELQEDVTTSAAAVIRVLILTGARLNEIRMLRWRQVDFTGRRLILEEHKADAHGAKAIPLNRPALEILNRQSANADEAGEFVFPGMIPGQPIGDMQKPWRRVRARAGLEDVRIHDLRHSFASFGIAVAASLPLVGGLLGHRTPAATAIYAHLSQEPLRAISEQIGDAIASRLFAPEPPALPPPSTGGKRP